jgi:hypothetical protein
MIGRLPYVAFNEYADVFEFGDAMWRPRAENLCGRSWWYGRL